MPPWLMTLLQQFGRDIVTNSPAVARVAQHEYRMLTDPYIDKHLYFFARGGEAERDAEEHRRYDTLPPARKAELARLQASGSWEPFENVPPARRRPWTGVFALPPAAEPAPDASPEQVRLPLALLSPLLSPAHVPPSPPAPPAPAPPPPPFRFVDNRRVSPKSRRVTDEPIPRRTLL